MAKPGGKALIALGSNVTSRHGDPAQTLKNALRALGSGQVTVRAVSRFFRTPAFPAGSGPDYVNAAVLVDTALAPEALLARLHEIEAEFDRRRSTRWASRTLDLDLIALDQQVVPDAGAVRAWIDLALAAQTKRTPDRLLLPHPRLHERAFVLVPAADVWPDWRHPLLGRTIGEMLAALPAEDVAAVVALDD